MSPTSYLCLESGLAPTLEDSAGTCQAGLGLSLFDPAAPAPAPLSLIPLPVGVELGFVARTIGDSEASPGMPSLDYHRPPPCRGWGAALQTGRLGFSTPGLCFCPHTPVSAPSGLTAPAPVEGGVEVKGITIAFDRGLLSVAASREEGGRPSGRSALSTGHRVPREFRSRRQGCTYWEQRHRTKAQLRGREGAARLGWRVSVVGMGERCGARAQRASNARLRRLHWPLRESQE